MIKSIAAFAAIVIATVGVGGALASASEQQVKLKIDGSEVQFADAKPYIDSTSGRTMVPVRFVSEKLGATVDWDGATQTVKMNKDGKRIALKIGEKKAAVSGKTISFDAAAQIKESRTFVPLRFVSEAYGTKVVWDKINKAVYIITKEKVRDAYGMKLYQQFHSNLKIEDGMLTGKLPRKSDNDIWVQCNVYYNDGREAQVFENGEAFKLPVGKIKAFGFSVYDQANGKLLIYYVYRSLPELTGLDVTEL